MPVITNQANDFVIKPKSHDQCLLCGNENKLGLGLKFKSIGSGVYTEVRGYDLLQGYNGILHGGVIAALLDSAMANALFKNGIEAVTGDMNIKFLKSIPVGSNLKVIGRVINYSSPLFRTEGEIILDRKIVASATARFVERGFSL